MRGNKTAYSEENAIARMRLCADKRGYTFIRFVGEFTKLGSTSSELYCPEHRHTWITNSEYFSRGRGRCEFCTVRGRTVERRIPDATLVEKFMSTGSYMDGTVFRRSSTGKQMWEVICPICSKDEYVLAGVCGGVFRQGYASLCDGSVACRCSRGYRYTDKQREFQVKQTFEAESLPYSLLGWVGTARSGKLARLKIICHLHNEFSPYLDTYINGGTRCPDCSVTGFNPNKPATLYVIRTNTFTGYGITCDFTHRLSVHKKYLKRSGYVVEAYETFELEGQQAKEIEKKISSHFCSYPSKVKGFLREATDRLEYESVLKFVEDQIEEYRTTSKSSSQPSEPAAVPNEPCKLEAHPSSASPPDK